MSEPQCRVHEWHRANRSTYVRTVGRTDKQVQVLSESVLAGYLVRHCVVVFDKRIETKWKQNQNNGMYAR